MPYSTLKETQLIQFKYLVALVLFSGIILTTSPLLSQDPDNSQAPSEENKMTESDADVSSGPPEPAQKVGVDKVTEDGAIAKRLTRIMNASKWVTDVNVEVEEGIVFLNGKATDDKYSEWAANVARNTDDVVAVVNNIEVTDTTNISDSMNQVGSSLHALWRDFLKRLPLLFAGMVAILFTWIISRIATSIVRRTTRHSRLRTSLRDLLVQLTTFFVWLTGIMVAAIIIFPGMTPAKLLTVLGLSSVAIGFAFKDIFENFFAGVLILWRFPFDKGDFIECGDLSGKVEDITIRMTEIRQVDGQLVVIPNAMLFKQAVHVLTDYRTRRITVMCGIAYDEDVDEGRDVIRQAVEKCESVNKDKPIEIFAREFGASSIDFEVTWWSGSTPLEERESRDEVVASVKRALDDSGIEIPFPYQTLTFKEPLQMVSDTRADSSS